MKNNIAPSGYSWRELLEMHPETMGKLGLDREKLREANSRLPVFITKHYHDLIDWDNFRDPLIPLVLPGKFSNKGHETTSGEREYARTENTQHKYSQTLLVKVTQNCFSYCRFCYRLFQGVGKEREVLAEIDEAVEYTKRNKEIREILFTGGDSLFLPTGEIKRLLDRFGGMEHIQALRFGTRCLAFYPQRITEDGKLPQVLRDFMRRRKTQVRVVAHFEHPREVTPETEKAVEILREAGAHHLNQTVFQKGINADWKTLVELFEKISSIGVLPYYLFQVRPVKTVTQRAVDLHEGSRIVRKANSHLSGPSRNYRYTMSTKNGKVEITGSRGSALFFKMLSSSNKKLINKPFSFDCNDKVYWLDDLVTKTGEGKAEFQGDSSLLEFFRKNMLSR